MAVWMPIGRYDYMAHICMIIICITPHNSVWLLTINSNQCMSGNQSMYVSMYYIQSKKCYRYLFL